MSEENRNRDESIPDDSNREETPGRQEISRDDEGATGGRDDQSKSGVDKLIDKAQEKGVFDKAAKTLKDKFGGGSGGSKGR